MRKTLMVLSATALLIGVAGCTSSPESVTDAGPVEVETEETPEIEAAPLKAAEPEDPDSPESVYLFEVRKRQDVTTIANATDEQLIAAAHEACEILRENPVIDDIQLIEGEVPRENGRYFESMVIATHAQMHVCPDVELVRALP